MLYLTGFEGLVRVAALGGGQQMGLGGGEEATTWRVELITNPLRSHSHIWQHLGANACIRVSPLRKQGVKPRGHDKRLTSSPGVAFRL